MSELIDTDVQRRVALLVEKLTDKRKFALDPELAKDVKRLCKASDANVRAAFEAITEQLKTNHAQVPLPTFPPGHPELLTFAFPSLRLTAVNHAQLFRSRCCTSSRYRYWSPVASSCCAQHADSPRLLSSIDL